MMFFGSPCTPTIYCFFSTGSAPSPVLDEPLLNSVVLFSFRANLLLQPCPPNTSLVAARPSLLASPLLSALTGSPFRSELWVSFCCCPCSSSFYLAPPSLIASPNEMTLFSYTLWFSVSTDRPPPFLTALPDPPLFDEVFCFVTSSMDTPRSLFVSLPDALSQKPAYFLFGLSIYGAPQPDTT